MKWPRAFCLRVYAELAEHRAHAGLHQTDEMSSARGSLSKRPRTVGTRVLIEVVKYLPNASLRRGGRAPHARESSSNRPEIARTRDFVEQVRHRRYAGLHRRGQKGLGQQPPSVSLRPPKHQGTLNLILLLPQPNNCGALNTYYSSRTDR